MAIAGDGGLSMLLGELITAVAYDLPMVFVFNNSTLGLVKLEMLVDGFPSFRRRRARRRLRRRHRGRDRLAC